MTVVNQQPRTRVGSAASRFIRSRDTLTLGVLVFLVIFFSVLQPNFLSQANWLNTATTATQLVLLAIGQTFVIITGGIDLSVGAVVSVSGVSAAWVMSALLQSSGGGPTLGIALLGAVLAIGVGTLFGMLNGFLVTRVNIPPFVATLGSMGVATGLSLLVSNGMSISALPSELGAFGRTNLLGWLPLPVLATAAIAWFFAHRLHKTRFGAHTYAIGDNIEAAMRSGINKNRHLMKVYLLSGGLAGTAGLLIMSRLTVASPAAGDGYELNAIACVVIGGASLFGGRGTIWGSVLGALIITCLISGLVVISVPPFWQLIVVGLVLIGAVALDQARNRTRSRN